MDVLCPRCQNKFECQAQCVSRCACFHIELSEDTRNYLKKTFYGCLCNNCLKELDNVVSELKDKSFSPNLPLEEGKDYYLENGLYVFTERYHIWKGYCCKKGCRHCAYGFTKNNYERGN